MKQILDIELWKSCFIIAVNLNSSIYNVVLKYQQISNLDNIFKADKNGFLFLFFTRFWSKSFVIISRHM